MYRNLCIVALFAIATSAQFVRDKTPITAEQEICAVTYKITSPEVLNGRPESILENPKTRCYAACLLIERKILNRDGTLNMQFAEQTIPAAVPNRNAIIASLRNCANQRGKDSCDTAYKTHKCFDKNEEVGKIHH